MPDNVYSETLPGGRAWSMVIRRHHAVRLTALEAGANLSALLFNAEHPLERYNMPDTLKAQYTFFLTAGHVLYSDMGRILMSITEDSCGWHDTVCGVSHRALLAEKCGEGHYQQLHNGFHRSGRELFLVELGKWGLGKRDLVANVNFFSKAAVDAAGNLALLPDHCQAGDSVLLRAEMDTLLVLNTAPHPLAPAGPYAPAPVKIEIFPCEPASEFDICRLSRPENARGFANTAIHHCQCHH